MNRGVPILVYHQVVDEDFDLNNVSVGDRPYYLKKAEFIQQMEYLFDQGFKTLTLGEFVGFIKDGGQLPTKSIVLTFDDGHISNYTHIYPILCRFNFKATFFLIVGKIGTPEKLDWEQIMEIVASGMEMGSHTITHPFLSNLKENEIFWELKRSKEVLENHLKKEIDFFSIPRELANSNWLKIARDCGYKTVCTSKVGLNKWNTNLFTLKRIGIKNGIDLNTFSQIANRERKLLFKLKIFELLKQSAKISLGKRRWFKLRERLLELKYR